MVHPIKIEFMEYPSGSWEDWSDYLVQPPRISKKVESDIEGEAGAIVFDSASIILYYENGNPVYNAFSIDLSAKQRYVFRISINTKDFFATGIEFETDSGDSLVDNNGNILAANYKAAQPTKIYEGMADFTTITWPELGKVISFNIADKLSALGILPADVSRSFSSLKARMSFTGTEEIYVYKTGPGEYIIEAIDGGNYVDIPTDSLVPGEIISYDNSGTTEFILVKSFSNLTAYDSFSQPYQQGDIIGIATNDPPSGISSEVLTTDNLYSKEVYGLDCGIYDIDGHLTSYDGIKLIQAFYELVWGTTTISNKTGSTTFPILLEFFSRLIDENPLGDDPLGAVKILADSMECYIYVDRDSNLVIQSKDSLDTNGTTRTIDTTKIIKKTKIHSWDKLADGATVKVKSWIQVDGAFIEGNSTQTKQIPGSTAYIKPKNEIKKTVLSSDSANTTVELLNSSAATKATSLLNFYGKRHSAYDLTLHLDTNTILWDLVDNLTIDSLPYFFSAIDLDLINKTISLKPAEASGHDYDLRQVVISNSPGSSNYSGGTTIYNQGSPFTGGTLTQPLITKQLASSTNIISGTSVDCSITNIFQITLSANTTLTLNNFADAQVINIVVINSGSYTLGFTNTIEWVSQTAPTLTNNGKDIITLMKINSVIYGSYVPDMG